MASRTKLSDKSARQDGAYHRAKESGFAARAVFKLMELDKAFHLFKPGKRVLDLGCWPGSWMQYTAERVGDAGYVLGIDLTAVELALPTWVTSRVEDVELLEPAALLAEVDGFDVVISDMAPHTTGDRNSDLWRSEELFLRALEIASAVLRPGGHFTAKVFQGGRFGELLKTVRRSFQEGKAFIPEATRAQSTEQYIVGRGFMGAKR